MDIESNIKCLKKIWSEYEGKWVAIKDGELLNHGDSYKKLYDEFKHIKDVVITRLVWEW